MACMPSCGRPVLINTPPSLGLWLKLASGRGRITPDPRVGDAVPVCVPVVRYLKLVGLGTSKTSQLPFTVLVVTSFIRIGLVGNNP